MPFKCYSSFFSVRPRFGGSGDQRGRGGGQKLVIFVNVSLMCEHNYPNYFDFGNRVVFNK